MWSARMDIILVSISSRGYLVVTSMDPSLLPWKIRGIEALYISSSLSGLPSPKILLVPPSASMEREADINLISLVRAVNNILISSDLVSVVVSC